jgi:hypothetical protein
MGRTCSEHGKGKKRAKKLAEKLKRNYSENLDINGKVILN